MTLYFLDLYNEVSGQPWSMFDNDAESVDDFESAMRISINKAVSYVWNIYDWCFKKRDYTFKTRANKNNYYKPNGQFTVKYISGEKTYGVRSGTEYLSYLSNPETLEDDTGEPEYFYIKDNKIYLYPTPDDIYSITVDYYLIPFGLTADNEEIFKLENDDDYINIPEVYEDLFKNCIISKAMVYALADQSDENHSGYTQQFDEALEVLLKFCEGDYGLTDKTIGW